MRSFARSPTSRPFSPLSMITMPATVSPRPSRVTAPWRGIAPVRTSATSRTSTGTPSTAVITTASMSACPVSRPTPRTVVRSARRSMNPPLNDTLLPASASITCCTPTP